VISILVFIDLDNLRHRSRADGRRADATWDPARGRKF
jgi:hypothetical protein